MSPTFAWIAIAQGLAYLAGCFTAGLVTGNKVAWLCALISVGVSYLSTIPLMPPNPNPGQLRANFVLSCLAILAGLWSGAALVIG